MELKLVNNFIEYLTVVRSNRTFMELKLGIPSDSTKRLTVLIVPLWN